MNPAEKVARAARARRRVRRALQDGKPKPRPLVLEEAREHGANGLDKGDISRAIAALVASGEVERKHFPGGHPSRGYVAFLRLAKKKERGAEA